MINFARAKTLSDEYRQRLQEGFTEPQAWEWLKEFAPDANVFERRRIAARGRQLYNLWDRLQVPDPPPRLDILYPLPPSTEAARPYLVEMVYRVELFFDGGVKYRMVVVDVPNNISWTAVESRIAEAVAELSSNYGSTSEPEEEFQLGR